uniref:Uncharacterized protein n=1 Tax=Candidatus Kentrum sp. FM TaxID=2126340 RepID=A0A450TXA4_9GAMM|nr:MAG: hypothetical protein BECKFM1743C_GA0114222_107503 [Candidatus Kentron sp. FM]VFJ74080.1 MAG: hypothetical protein BECKFM1743A_GA0114220_107563 [Candidatus Kentron sp. FM]VFK20855.1 MAG: hypothetical protein BECKFM1743B_GA0114221_107351 [Candidatus Kentron sp. FM]
MSHEIRERKSTVTMEVNEHFERLSLIYPYLGLGVQDDFCIQLEKKIFLLPIRGGYAPGITHYSFGSYRVPG